MAESEDVRAALALPKLHKGTGLGFLGFEAIFPFPTLNLLFAFLAAIEVQEECCHYQKQREDIKPQVAMVILIATPDRSYMPPL